MPELCSLPDTGSSLEKYGADVDDSVNYQVYNNFGADKEQIKQYRIQKVRSYARSGESAPLFSSAGRTSTDEIWGQTGQQLI